MAITVIQNLPKTETYDISSLTEYNDEIDWVKAIEVYASGLHNDGEPFHGKINTDKDFLIVTATKKERAKIRRSIDHFLNELKVYGFVEGVEPDNAIE